MTLFLLLTRLKPLSSFLIKADDAFMALKGWLRFLRSYSCRDPGLCWRDDGEFNDAILLLPRAVFVECLLPKEPCRLKEGFPEDLFCLEEVLLLSSSGNRKANSWSVIPAIPAPQKFIVGQDFSVWKDTLLFLLSSDCILQWRLKEEQTSTSLLSQKTQATR